MSNLSDTEVMKRIGEKLRELRLKEGFQINEVANYTGLDDSLISKFERNKRKINLSNLNILLKFYEISFSQFFIDID